MKYLALLTFLIAGCPSLTVQAPETASDGHAVLQHALQSTVAIVDLGEPFCSGVFISNDRVLTAAHCVEGEDVVDVGMYGDELNGQWMTDYPFAVVHRDEVHDFAVLRPDTLIPLHDSVDLSPTSPEQGDRAIAIGHPYGLVYTVTDGLVSYPERCYFWDNGECFMQISAPLAPGNSGGPVFNYYGELIGIAKIRFEPHLSGAVPLSVIRAALN